MVSRSIGEPSKLWIVISSYLWSLDVIIRMDLPNNTYRLPIPTSSVSFPPAIIHENTPQAQSVFPQQSFMKIHTVIHGENTYYLLRFCIKEDGLGIHSHIGIFCLIITVKFLLRKSVEQETSITLQSQQQSHCKGIVMANWLRKLCT